MCGIVGLIDARGLLGVEQLRETVVAMREGLVHRGPDEAGLFVDDEAGCAFGHRRLSVIDPTPCGSQPMSLPGDRFSLVYNGELYNTDDLKNEFSDVRWRGHCDTEVLLHVLARDGAKALGRFNGMFAFGFYDAEKRTLLLARDRFGQKPLYYHVQPGTFAFSSELRSLMKGPGFDDTVDQDSLAEYLLLQYVHAPRTIFRGTFKLPPGSYITVSWGRDGSDEIRVDGPHRYFSWPSDDGGSETGKGEGEITDSSDLVSTLDTLIQQAVERRLVSDVPLGAMLSGGIDSTLIVAAMTRLITDHPVRTFSIGFEGSEESEHESARRTAEVLGTEHYDETISPDVSALMPVIAAALDEPLGDSSCLPTWCLSRMIRKHVTVALSGDGGDELFGGYQRYALTLREARSWAWRMRWWYRTKRRWKAADAYCSERWWMIMPTEIRRLLGDWPSGAEPTAEFMRGLMSDESQPLIHRMRFLDAKTYLPGAVLAKVDRMSMAHSLEVRSPFLDPEIARFAEGLAPEACFDERRRMLKPLLRAVCRKYVPDSWSKQPKRGFGLPSSGWSCDSMIEMCDDLLRGSDSRCGSLMDSEALRRGVDWQRHPERFSVYQVWTVLILELWLRGL